MSALAYAYRDDEPELLPPPYVPWPQQRAFHDSRARFRLMGGAAGGGKSRSLRWELIRQCQGIPGWHTLLLRSSFPELEQHRKALNEECPGLLVGDIAKFPNGSTLRFGYSAADRDVTRFQGDEYGAIAFDELTHFTLFQWLYLRSRNRSSNGYRPNMMGGTNPGGIGHSWVKALWIDKVPCEGITGYDPDDYEFIPAKLEDNPSLDLADPNYRKNLEGMAPHLRAQLLDGSWDVVAGAYYSQITRTSKLPERWHKRWASMDWGFQHPSVVLWFAQDEDGFITCYRERVFRQTAAGDLARAVAEASGDEQIDALYLSPDAWAKKSDERTIGDQLSDVWADNDSLGLQPQRATTARTSGWQLILQLFHEQRLAIHESCTELLRSLPLMQRNDAFSGGDPEDCQKLDGIDDAPDAFRYGLASRLGITRVPYSVRVERRMADLARDLGPVHGQDAVMRARLVESKERKVGRPLRLARRA